MVVTKYPSVRWQRLGRILLPMVSSCAWVVLAPQDAADSTKGVMEVAARIWVPSTNGSCVEIDGYDNSPLQFEKRGFHARFFPDGTVTYYRTQENPIPGLTIDPPAKQFPTVSLVVAHLSLGQGTAAEPDVNVRPTIRKPVDEETTEQASPP